MTHYIPTISDKLEAYPFLKKTIRRNYYRFKKLPKAIYNSLSYKAQNLYDEIEDREEKRFWNQASWSTKAAIVCACIGTALSISGLFLRCLVE